MLPMCKFGDLAMGKVSMLFVGKVMDVLCEAVKSDACVLAIVKVNYRPC